MRVPPFIFLAFCLGVFLIGAKGGAGATVRNNYNSNWIQTGHDPQYTSRLPPSPNRRPILSQPSVLFDAIDSSAALYTSGVQNTQPLIHNDGTTPLSFTTPKCPKQIFVINWGDLICFLFANLFYFFSTILCNRREASSS